MIGTILFWLMYIISGLTVYTVLRCTYIRKELKYKKYEETDERLKHPLWFIILLIIGFLIPMVNIMIPIATILIYYIDDYRGYYYKSFLTKKY